MTRHEVILWAEDCARAIRAHGSDVTACGRGDIEKLEFVIRALRDPEPEPEPRRDLNIELFDLVKLMPDSQVDGLLEFIRELRAVRRAHQSGPFDVCSCGHVRAAHGDFGCTVPAAADFVFLCQCPRFVDRQQTAGPQQERAK